MSQAVGQPIVYTRLRSDRPQVAFFAEGCLPGRSPLSNCEACATACPVDALTAAKGGLELGNDCLRCGRCATVCPTGAIRVAGFDPDSSWNPRETAARMECWRASADGIDAAAEVRVPCLGGVDSGRILRLHALSGGQGPVLMDRGWCAECPAGAGVGHPAQAALDAACSALRAAGVAEDHLPRLEAAAESGKPVYASIPDPLAQDAVSRRGFFRHMAGHAANTVDSMRASEEAEGEGEPRPLIDHIPAPPRERVVAAFKILHGETLPAALRPAVSVDADSCCNQQICAALCPTGALRAVREEEGSGLDFDPEPCIQCGLCAAVCPERALRVEETGGEAVALIRHREQSCEECQRPFPERGSERLCPTCRKKHGLLDGGGFELLFGGRPASSESDNQASSASHS